MPKTYNHAYTLAFEVKGSVDPQGDDVTWAMLRQAVLHKIAELDAGNTWIATLGIPFDTVEEETNG
jgi:hypothetical protein